MKFKKYSYFMANFRTPNLIVHGFGVWDLTATFAHIESAYGSSTQCDEAEALRRRAQKENLKLQCVHYAFNGPDDGDRELEITALNWLLPKEPVYFGNCYSMFTLESKINE